MTKEEAIDLISRSSFAEQATLLAERLEPSVRIVAKDNVDTSARSWLGGLPLLPRGTQWPRWDRRDYYGSRIARMENGQKNGLGWFFNRKRKKELSEKLSAPPVPLAFLGQLVLSELAHAAALPGWPLRGVLSFFYDVSEFEWGFDPSSRGFSRVLYFPEDAEFLSSEAPEDLPKDAAFSQRRVSFEREWTLPTSMETSRKPRGQTYEDLCNELMPGVIGGQVPIHRCGGYPQEIQGPMELECQLVTNGVYCGGGDHTADEDLRRSALESGAIDWKLLLQIDTDDRMGWMWGDMGRLYFWIRQQDLAEANFAGAWTILQCG